LKPYIPEGRAEIMCTENEINGIVEQTNLAFDFMQRLYLETSYLIKEVEGILQQEEERFIIGKLTGYGVTARGSTGLESINVNLWPLRKFAVFFVPKDKTKAERGKTFTGIDENLKVLYLRIVLNDKDIEEPAIYTGVLYKIQKRPEAKGIRKFENVMSHIEWRDDKIFGNGERINYEDACIKFLGEFIKNDLFEINDSEAIRKRIVEPSLELYRKY
jgi:hypothetical protein